MKSENTEGDGLVNIEQAKRTVRAEQELRVRAFLQELQASVANHRCRVFAVPQFAADGRTVAVIKIAAGDCIATLIEIGPESPHDLTTDPGMV